jgi:hypothetical protein
MKGAISMLDRVAMKRQCKSFVAISVQIFLVSFLAISAGAQGPNGVPAKPAQAKMVGHPRKATLRELYEMFFTFAAHVETTADAGAQRGRDMTFYRAHLQKASGLDAVEYARVLDAAQRFAAVDADAQRRLSELMKEAKAAQTGTTSSRIGLPAGDRTQVNSLLAQKASSLTDEIANVRHVLGEERASMFETYLQTKYVMGHIGPAAPATNGSAPTRGKSKATPATLDPGESCHDFYFDEGDGVMEICADAQISYLGSPGSDSVEFYAYMDFDGSDPNGIAWSSYSVEGDFYIDGDEDEDLDCSADDSQTCITDVELTSGNGVTYSWIATGYVDWVYDDDCDGWCDSDDGSEDSPTADVTIYYPAFSISPSSIEQGQNGTFTLSGSDLVSPFGNKPTVSVTNEDAVFDEFSMQSDYSESTIYVDFETQADADTGDQTVQANNGFGSGSADITVNEAPQPPTITGIAVNGVANAPLQAGTQQTVTLTGTKFGTSDNVTVYTDGQYITVDSVGTPSVAHRTQAANKGSISSNGRKSAQPYDDQTLTFTVTTAEGAPSGTASFDLLTNDGAKNPDTITPAFTVDPVPPPTITGIAVNGVANAPLQAGAEQTVTLTGTNFGTSDQVTVYVDGQYITVDSVGTPSVAHRAPAANAGSKSSNGGKSAKPDTVQTLQFTVTTSENAPGGDASFELITNAAGDPDAITPNVAVDPITPTVSISTQPPYQVEVGQTINLSATGTPPDGTYGWSSGDTTIVEVQSSSGNGVTLQADAMGAAIVTVTYTAPSGLTATATATVTVTTPDIVVIGWIDANAITLPNGASAALKLALNTYGTCSVTLIAWSNGNTLDLLGTAANIKYANAWLLKNSGNTAPPPTIDPATVLSGGDFRLFNESQWTFFQSDGKLSSATQITGTAAVGATPDPCGVLPPVPGQNHPDNGASGITKSADAVYQLAEGRIGTTGQAVNQTINGRTTPYIWSVIEFDTSGVATTTDTAIFPAYSVYKDGVQIAVYPETQSKMNNFIAKDDTYQRLPSQIK